MAQVTINVDKLLSFFDSDATARTHSSSLKALVGEELMLALLIESAHGRRWRVSVP